MHHSRVLIATLCVCGLFVAASAPADDPKPVLFAEQDVINAGTVIKGKIISQEFTLRNDGDAPLEIIEARPSCGCTVVDYDELVLPGSSTTLTAEIDTSTLDGPSASSITVFTNDPANPQVVLTVRLAVSPAVIFNPGIARFIRGHGHKPGQIEQLVLTPSFEELEITGIESPFPYLSADFRPAAEDEGLEPGVGKQWVLDLVFDYDKAPVGPFDGKLVVKTNHPDQPVAELVVSGFVRPLVAVTPQGANFGDLELTDPVVARFLVHNFGAADMVITGADPALDGMEVAIKPLEDGRKYNIELTLSPSMPKGAFDTVLKIRTDSKREPVIEVPLKGTIL